MKKKLLLLGVVGICLAVLAYGTAAYFTDEAAAHNVITSGGVRIALLDKTEDAGGMPVDFPPDGLMGVMPGTAASRTVSVRNIGGDGAWVRIRVTRQILSHDSRELPLLLEEDIPAMTFAVDGEKWLLEDGWYYYRAPIAGGETTAPLFEQVEFSAGMGNAYQNAKASMNVYVQAVQAANNGNTALEAAGWPAEETE